jgi:hypothetical protein
MLNSVHVLTLLIVDAVEQMTYVELSLLPVYGVELCVVPLPSDIFVMSLNSYGGVVRSYYLLIQWLNIVLNIGLL